MEAEKEITDQQQELDLEHQDQVVDLPIKEGSAYGEKPRLESLTTNDSSFKNNMLTAKVTFMSKNIENIKDQEKLKLKSQSERIASVKLNEESYQQEEELEPSIDDYELGEILGRGAYGVVNLATEKATGITVAIKSVSIEQVSSLGKERHIFREKDLLNSLQHPTIIKLLKTFKDSDNLYFVFEHAINGTLDDFVKLTCKNKVGEELVKILFA